MSRRNHANGKSGANRNPAGAGNAPQEVVELTPREASTLREVALAERKEKELHSLIDCYGQPLVRMLLDAAQQWKDRRQELNPERDLEEALELIAGLPAAARKWIVMPRTESEVDLACALRTALVASIVRMAQHGAPIDTLAEVAGKIAREMPANSQAQFTGDFKIPA